MPAICSPLLAFIDDLHQQVEAYELGAGAEILTAQICASLKANLVATGVVVQIAESLPARQPEKA